MAEARKLRWRLSGKPKLGDVYHLVGTDNDFSHCDPTIHLVGNVHDSRPDGRICGRCVNIERRATPKPVAAIIANTKHGQAVRTGRSRVYSAWRSMWTRVRSKSGANAKHYVARGITVCDRWKDFDTFYSDMGDPPDGCSLDRIDNDLGYAPENCRWATASQQARNTRKTKLSEAKAAEIIRLRHAGSTIDDLAELFNVSRGTVQNVVSGKTWKDVPRAAQGEG